MNHKLWLRICIAIIAVSGFFVAYLIIAPSTDRGKITFDYVDNSKIYYNKEKTYEINGSDGAYSITEPGAYILSGDFEQGIVIDAKNDVHLILNNANIKNNNGSAIYVKSANIVYIITKSDSSISDSKNYQSYNEENVDAAIYSKEDLVFVGKAKLEISGNHNHAIHSNDSIQIINGEYDITSINDSIVGKDYVAIKDGILNINSGDNGIRSTETDSARFGFIAVDGGTITVNSGGDGINSSKNIRTTGGTLIATGNNNIFKTISTDSTQNNIVITFSNAQTADSLSELKDPDGNTVISYRPNKDFTSIFISSKNIEKGSNYAVNINNKTITTLNIKGKITYHNDSQ